MAWEQVTTAAKPSGPANLVPMPRNSRYSERTNARPGSTVTPNAPKESKADEARRQVRAFRSQGMKPPDKWLKILAEVEAAEKAADAAKAEAKAAGKAAKAEAMAIKEAVAHFKGTPFASLRGIDALELFRNAAANAYADRNRA